MVLKVSCKGSNSINVGHNKQDNTSFYVGKHLIQCCGTAHNIELDLFDACCRVDKLRIFEATYFKKVELASKYSRGGRRARVDNELLDRIRKHLLLNSKK